MSRNVPSERLWELEQRYRGRFEVEPLSYGTVRDLADSVDNLGGLARASSDMKDLQRCWMVKAILGVVEPGGRLVEIGAGEPLVADLLSRLGYEVTIVDPYDGSGQGPREFEEFSRSHPEVTFIRERFPPSAGLEGTYAAVYSVSVLEHIPLEALGGVIAQRPTCSPPAALRYTRSTTSWPAGGRSSTWSASRRSCVGRACRWIACTSSSGGSNPIPRPISSPPKRTSAGGARCRMTATRCAGSRRSAC